MMHSFDPQIAVKVGVNAAIIYANISWWCAKNAANGHNVHDGRAWTYNSVRAWTELFPYMTAKQVRSALSTLEDDGLIVSGEYNESAYDRTKWYAPKEPIDLPHRATHFASEGEPIPVIKPDITIRDTNVSLVTEDAQIAFGAYNDAAKRAGWPKAQTLTKARASSLKARLKECGGLDGWHEALSKAEASPHLCGQNDRGWRADLDFILQQKSFTKLMEGSYDRKQPNRLGPSIGSQSRSGAANQAMLSGFLSAAAEKSGRD